jgi:hypothetical protein
MLQLSRNEPRLLHPDQFGQLRLPMHMRVKPLEDFRQLRRYIFPDRLKILTNRSVDAHEFEPFSKQ